MTGDIVTRLRDYLAIVDHAFVWNELSDAADEIERLRKQRDELAWAIAWFLNGGSRDKLEQRFKAYEATL